MHLLRQRIVASWQLLQRPGFSMINLSSLVSSSYRNRLFWVLHIIGWAGVGVLSIPFAGITYLTWVQAAALSVGRTTIGFVLTWRFRTIYQRFLKSDMSTRTIVVAVILICFAGSCIDQVFTRVYGNLLGYNMQDADVITYLRSSIAMRWLIYLFWSVLYFGCVYWLDTQRMQLELAEAEAFAQASELKMLKAQINPHFLFNALNSILAESGDNPRLRNLTLALSDYLRFSLQQQRDRGILGHELEALENYLRVEKARFEDNLEYVIETDAQSRSALAPNALIQPLLENAIKYGQRTSQMPLRLRIEARVEKREGGDELMVRVTNSGKWVPPETNQSTKTGLANLRRRLELVYAGRARLDVNTRDQEVAVTVWLPAEQATRGRE